MANVTPQADADLPLAGLASSGRMVSRASLVDAVLAMRDVILPTLAKGPLIRRRAIVSMAEREGMDDKAVTRMQALRRKYGSGPLVLPVPFRPQALLFSAEDVQTVLAHSPDPLQPLRARSRRPWGTSSPAMCSPVGETRVNCGRRLNEEALETGCERHSMGGRFARIIAEEMDLVGQEASDCGRLDWDIFFTGWMRMVRRIVLGDAARNDAALTDLLEKLRYRANFAFLRPKARDRRQMLLDRLARYVDAAEPGSLVSAMARHGTKASQLPHHQLPQYLFAFDPGGMASFRTLATLCVDGEARRRVLTELAEAAGEAVPRLPLLRACFLESVRLWPTTPAILRETLQSVAWSGGRLQAGTQVIVFTPFFHRDDETWPDAHVFNPDRWIGRVARPEQGLVPFSYGPVQCPAAHFVPMVASLALRHLITRLDLQLTEPERLNLARLPGSLDNFTLNFSAAQRAAPDGR